MRPCAWFSLPRSICRRQSSFIVGADCFTRFRASNFRWVRLATWNVNSVKQRRAAAAALAGRAPPRRGLPAGDEARRRRVRRAARRRAGQPRLRGRRPRRGDVERRRDPLAGRPGRRRRGARGRARLPRSRGACGVRHLRRNPRACRSTCPTVACRTPSTTDYKLAWLAALRELVAARARATIVVCGDMNIAPTDEDVFDPEAYVGQTHVTPPERAALAELRGTRPARRRPRSLARQAGLHLLGLPRRDVPPGPRDANRPDPRRRAASPSASRRPGSIARRARARGPSDHAPVIVDLDEAPDGDIGPVVPPPSAPVAKPGAARSCPSRAVVARAGGRGLATAAPAWARRASSGSRAGRACRPGPRPRRARTVQQRLQRMRDVVDRRVQVADLGEPGRHRRDGEVLRRDVGQLVPCRPAPTPAPRASAARCRPRRSSGRGRSGCSR